MQGTRRPLSILVLLDIVRAVSVRKKCECTWTQALGLCAHDATSRTFQPLAFKRKNARQVVEIEQGTGAKSSPLQYARRPRLA